MLVGNQANCTLLRGVAWLCQSCSGTCIAVDDYQRRSIVAERSGMNCHFLRGGSQATCESVEVSWIWLPATRTQTHLGVPKFIPLEVEIAFSAESVDNQARPAVRCADCNKESHTESSYVEPGHER